MDGSARPAGELTMIAGLSPSAASAHLARLTDGGLLALEVRGRHRYFRIATPEIAASIEALANVAQVSAPQRAAPRPVAHRAARHALRAHLLRPYGGRIVGAGVRAAGRARPADAARHVARGHAGRRRPFRRLGHRHVRAEEPPAPLRLHLPRLERAASASGRRARRGAARFAGRRTAGSSAPSGRESCAITPAGHRHFDAFLAA